MRTIDEIISTITPADGDIASEAVKRLDSLTKPQGSLGRLEECAIKYVAARGSLTARIEKPAILTFAGDHGVADEGVSAFPQEVTAQMVANFANGGAAINVLSKHAGASLEVIDSGVATPCDFPKVVNRKIAFGTANFIKGPAMSIEETEKALLAGVEMAERAIRGGSTLIGTGDMGIANTTPSAALYSVFLDIDPAQIVGRGTGIDDGTLAHKVDTIQKAIDINSKNCSNTLATLAALGGFEIAGICGAIIGSAVNKIPVVIDGFISGAAAVTAMQFNRDVIDYCFFSHLSAEAGHSKAMSTLGIQPLLNLNLRLGEGTGSALAFNIIEAGVKIMHEMATFQDAAVSNRQT